jgi:protein-L-isoaspartate(D-aspartate) O-methyltransferase
MLLEDYRRFYSEEIRFVANLTSAAVAEALARVPREKFMGPSPWQVASAESLGLASLGLCPSAYVTTNDPRDLYHNVLVALDADRQLNNGHPSTLTSWINALELRAGERVFHAGSGVGYYTAIMAEVVGVEGSVFAAEVDASLAARAAANLAAYGNVSVHAIDAAVADPGECDAMLINAGVTHPHLPWLDRLRDRGRMLLPITFVTPGASTGTGLMIKITRVGKGFAASVISMVGIYSCTSVRDPALEPMLQKALASRKLLKLKSVRREPHDQNDACIVHAREVCLSSEELNS